MSIEREQEQNIMRKDAVIAYLNNLIKEIDETIKNDSLTSEQKNEIIGNISKIADSITNDESYYYDNPVEDTKEMIEYFGYSTSIDKKEKKYLR